jgi:hypothetical protein
VALKSSMLRKERLMEKSGPTFLQKACKLDGKNGDKKIGKEECAGVFDSRGQGFRCRIQSEKILACSAAIYTFLR